MMKAVRSIELGLDTLTLPELRDSTDSEEEIEQLHRAGLTSALFCVYEALKRGMPPRDYLRHHQDRLVVPGQAAASGSTWSMSLKNGELTTEDCTCNAKKFGFLDKTIQRLSGAGHPARNTAAAAYQDGGYLRCGIRRRNALFLLHLRRGKRSKRVYRRAAATPTRRRCWSSAPAPSASARALSSTTARSTASGR